VNGSYVVWQAFQENAWRVNVYDTVTKEITTIDDAEGASVENPRFVLVYDSKQDNGDIETRGYDLKEKRSVPLGASPNEVPESIPDPDQTGEDRALLRTINEKPKDEGENDSDDTPLPPTEDDEGDVVIPPFEEVIPDITEEGVSTTTDATPPIDDLVIGTPDTEMEHVDPEVEHIEDIVIPPFTPPVVEESSEEESAQTGVSQ
jgi:hypothetical protein